MKSTRKIILAVFVLQLLNNSSLIAQLDTIAPQITITQDTSCIQLLSNWMFTDPVVSDNQSPAQQIVVTQQWGANGPANTRVRGSYQLRVEATDTSGNKAVRLISYRVDDCIAPVIDLNTTDTVCHIVNTPYHSVSPNVTDNYYDAMNVSLVNVSQGNVDAYTLGVYAEIFVAVDGSGNRDSATRYVWVREKGKCTVGLLTLNKQKAVKIYPNPARFAISLSIPLGYNYKIYNYLGVQVLNGIAEESHLDILSLPIGAYQIVAKSSEGIWSGKFIKE